MAVIKGRRKFLIQPHNVDFQGYMAMSSIGHILLDAADKNADDNGFGFKDLQKINSAWVLSRLAIEMSHYPGQYEQIEVETWISGIWRIITTRDFCIRNANDQTIAHASSIWAMIDTTTRRPVDMEKLEKIHTFVYPHTSLIERPIKLIPITGELVETLKVKYSDIDINGHANSIRYIEWISNCFSLNDYRNHKLKRFEINYISEMKYGDTIEIYREEITENDFRFEIRKEGKVTARARILFEK